jgi:hypothetical protein
MCDHFGGWPSLALAQLKSHYCSNQRVLTILALNALKICNGCQSECSNLGATADEMLSYENELVRK